MDSMNIQDILKILPHRYPFLMIDKVLDVNYEEKSIITQKNVTFNEPMFQGHFPSQPVFPGVMLIEAMAQSSALLAFAVKKHSGIDDSVEKIYYLVGVDKFKVRQPVVPGDVLIIKSKFEKNRNDIYKLSAIITVNDKIICSCILTAAYR